MFDKEDLFLKESKLIGSVWGAFRETTNARKLFAQHDSWKVTGGWIRIRIIIKIIAGDHKSIDEYAPSAACHLS